MFLISQELLAQQLFNDGAALLNGMKRCDPAPRRYDRPGHEIIVLSASVFSCLSLCVSERLTVEITRIKWSLLQILLLELKG